MAESVARAEALLLSLADEARAAGRPKAVFRALNATLRELYLRSKLQVLRAEIVFGVIGIEEWALDESADRGKLIAGRRAEAVR